MILEDEATILLSFLEHSNRGYVDKLPIMLTAKPLVVQLLLEREHCDNLNKYEEILNCWNCEKRKKNSIPYVSNADTGTSTPFNHRWWTYSREQLNEQVFPYLSRLLRTH